jgi:hypothetical protein
MPVPEASNPTEHVARIPWRIHNRIWKICKRAPKRPIWSVLEYDGLTERGWKVHHEIGSAKQHDDAIDLWVLLQQILNLQNVQLSRVSWAPGVSDPDRFGSESDIQVLLNQIGPCLRIIEVDTDRRTRSDSQQTVLGLFRNRVTPKPGGADRELGRKRDAMNHIGISIERSCEVWGPDVVALGKIR